MNSAPQWVAYCDICELYWSAGTPDLAKAKREHLAAKHPEQDETK